MPPPSRFSPPPPCPAGSLSAVSARAPPFVPPPPLWRRHRPHRDACLKSGDRSGVRSHAARASSRAGQAKAGPARRRPRALGTGQASAVAVVVGHACYAHGPSQRHQRGPRALCNWAEHGFGPVAVELNFLFSEYIQFLANSKKLCRIHLNSENYETNFIG
jgi:hypothetical protein